MEKEKIFLIRGQKVMLSTHLAHLYEVEPRVLVQAVKRNMGRFPEDFMFQLTEEEFGNLKSQIVISSWGGARRARPYAFTEQGVAMLSSVLRSNRAVQVNIEIMRAFVRLRGKEASNITSPVIIQGSLNHNSVRILRSLMREKRRSVDCVSREWIGGCE